MRLIVFSTSAVACLLLERFLRLVEQAHVLDRDHRLIGKGPQEADFLIAEWAHFLAAQQDRPERLALAKERRDDHGAMAEALGDIVAQGYSAPAARRSGT